MQTLDRLQTRLDSFSEGKPEHWASYSIYWAPMFQWLTHRYSQGSAYHQSINHIKSIASLLPTTLTLEGASRYDSHSVSKQFRSDNLFALYTRHRNISIVHGRRRAWIILDRFIQLDVNNFSLLRGNYTLEVTAPWPTRNAIHVITLSWLLFAGALRSS